MAVKLPPRPAPLLYATPSYRSCCSKSALPWIANAADPYCVPPTSWLFVVTPGMSTPTDITDLVPTGIASTISRVITFCWTTFCTSTVGAAPDTVIVSSSAPTRRSAFTVAVNDAVNVTPSRLTTLNPLSVNVTE